MNKSKLINTIQEIKFFFFKKTIFRIFSFAKFIASLLLLSERREKKNKRKYKERFFKLKRNFKFPLPLPLGFLLSKIQSSLLLQSISITRTCIFEIHTLKKNRRFLFDLKVISSVSCLYRFEVSVLFFSFVQIWNSDFCFSI